MGGGGGAKICKYYMWASRWLACTQGGCGRCISSQGGGGYYIFAFEFLLLNLKPLSIKSEVWCGRVILLTLGGLGGHPHKPFEN